MEVSEEPAVIPEETNEMPPYGSICDEIIWHIWRLENQEGMINSTDVINVINSYRDRLN